MRSSRQEDMEALHSDPLGEPEGSEDDLNLTATRPENKKPVGAVLAVVKVLRFLSDNPEPIGASHLAKNVGLYPSTCFNILRTLAQDDLISFDPATKMYALGLGVIDFARGFL